MRVLIRFTVVGEEKNKLRDRLNGHLRKAGFRRDGETATWEQSGLSMKDAAVVTQGFWKKAANFEGTGSMNHFWMFTDTAGAEPAVEVETVAEA